MTNRALIFAFALAMLGPAHAQMEKSTAAKCVGPKDCVVTVTVKECKEYGITVDPETLQIASGLKDVTITWKLKAPKGFAFAPDGITFRDKGAGKEFGKSKPGATEFQWVDKNIQEKEGKARYRPYKYNVKVTKDAKDCPQLDPIVVNDV